MEEFSQLYYSLKALAEDHDNCLVLKQFTILASYGTYTYSYAIVNTTANIVYALIDDLESGDVLPDVKKAGIIHSRWGYCMYRHYRDFSFYDFSGEEREENYNNWDNFTADFVRVLNQSRYTNSRATQPTEEELRLLCGECEELKKAIIKAWPKASYKDGCVVIRPYPYNITYSKALYRYISSTAFARLMTEDCGVCPSFPLASICSMNDKWEYASGVDIIKESPIRFRDVGTIDTYIMSLSKVNPHQSLTMWRLYGENSKGVCLEFKVMNKNYLHPVKYLDKYSGISTLNTQNTFIKMPPAILYRLKSSLYKLEEEVRLIVINRKKSVAEETWINGSGSGLLFPIIKLTQKDKLPGTNETFPLKLKKIILGANYKQAALNVALIERRLSELGCDDVEVEVAPDLKYKPD